MCCSHPEVFHLVFNETPFCFMAIIFSSLRLHASTFNNHYDWRRSWSSCKSIGPRFAVTTYLFIPSGPHHNALFLLLHSMMKSDPFYPSSNIQTRGSIKLVSDYPSFWPLIQSRLSLCFDSRIVTHLFHTDIRSVCRRLVIVVGVGITAKFWSNRQQVSLLCLVNCLIVSYCCVTTTSSSNFSLWVNGLTNVIKWNMVQNWKVRRTRNQKESLNTQRGPSFITDVAQHEFEIKQTPESIYTKNPCKVERRRLEG